LARAWDNDVVEESGTTTTEKMLVLIAVGEMVGKKF